MTTRPGSPGALVGRVTELARLHTLLERARGGHTSIALISGEPGIGKTHLATEFCSQAHEAACTVIAGRCFEGGWTRPYAPFAEALDALAHGDASLRVDVGAPAELRHLVPAWAYDQSDSAPGDRTGGEDRYRMFEAVAHLLEEASATAPIVLIVEDAQWADADTLELLRHVARTLRTAALLIVTTYREEEVAGDQRLVDTLAEIEHQAAAERLHLPPLSDESASVLINATAGADVAPAVAASIAHRCEGNPLFLRQFVLHLLDQRVLEQRGGVLTAETATIEGAGLPPNVTRTVLRRIDRLTPQARRLLTAASAFDGDLRLDVAASIAGLSEGEMLDAIDSSLAASIISTGAGIERYRFVHALVRDAIYESLNPSRGVRLHRQMAEALERIGDDCLAGEIAYHYRKSASLPGADRGAAHALTAAQRAEESYAWDDAVTWLRTALELMHPDDPVRPGSLTRLTWATMWTSAVSDTAGIALEAAEELARTASVEEAANFCADIADDLGRAGSREGRLAVATQGLVYAGERRDMTWARLRCYQLDVLDEQRSGGPGIRALDSPERREFDLIVRGLDDEKTPAQLHGEYGQPSREAVLRDPHPNSDALMNLAGEYLRVLPSRIQIAETAERRGAIGPAAMGWELVARCYAALGELPKADAAVERCRSMHERQLSWLGSRSAASLSWGTAASVWWASFTLFFARGSGPERDKARRAPPGSLARFLPPGLTFAAIVVALDGRTDEAAPHLDRILKHVRTVARGYEGAVNDTCFLAYLLWLIGTPEHAPEAEQLLREHALEPDFRAPMADPHLSMALLCALQGRHDEASAHFAEARSVLDEQGARPLRALCDYDEALMYMRRGRRGDRARALPLIHAALAQFERIGMTGWHERGSQLLEQALAGRPSQVLLPAGITAREAEVLRLVAAGRTNTEIAQALTLSVRTVARHITNIYCKIGARNRAEAATYVSRHSLT